MFTSSFILGDAWRGCDLKDDIPLSVQCSLSVKVCHLLLTPCGSTQGPHLLSRSCCSDLYVHGIWFSLFGAKQHFGTVDLSRIRAGCLLHLFCSVVSYVFYRNGAVSSVLAQKSLLIVLHECLCIRTLWDRILLLIKVIHRLDGFHLMCGLARWYFMLIIWLDVEEHFSQFFCFNPCKVKQYPSVLKEEITGWMYHRNVLLHLCRCWPWSPPWTPLGTRGALSLTPTDRELPVVSFNHTVTSQLTVKPWCREHQNHVDQTVFC